jgi:putative CocE/NonD family hydrolase
MHRGFRLLVALPFLIGPPTLATAADAAPAEAGPAYQVTEHYTKYEYRIPMRDGTMLFTVVHVPKDATRTHPFLVKRTPYAVGAWDKERLRYGVDFQRKQLGPSEAFDKAGYIFVEQDVRGRFMSEGKWLEMQPPHPAKRGPKDVDASTDMFDTVEWLLKHVPGHNGRVGIWGVSYPGFYAAASIIDSHPAIRAASPQAPVIDLYMNDDAFHNGAFMLAANYDFLTLFTPQQNPTAGPSRWDDFEYGTTSGYDYFLKLGTLRQISLALKPEMRPYFDELLDHPTYDDFWKARNLAPHLKNVRCAVLTVGGWYDAEDPQGPLTAFAQIERLNPGATNLLVMGPWAHGQWARRDGARIGHVSFAAPTADFYRKQILFPFFEKHLRGAPAKGTAGPDGQAREPTFELGKANVFETGTNVWRRYPAWPPPGAERRTLYFQAGGGLAFSAPSTTPAPAFDEYRSDPARPVPFAGYPTSGSPPQEYVVGDQRFAATRPDVLVYQTEPLEEDLTVVGPVAPSLFVSTSGTDADWVVKLIDVYPADYPEPPAEGGDAAATPKAPNDVPVPKLPLGGYQQLIRGEPLRGKYRNSFERPEPFVPGQVTSAAFRMPDIAHTFRRGHRVMVQVQSSWFPLIDRNPQTFVNIPDARPEDFQAATHRVYRSGAQASGVVLQVLPGPGR